MKKKRILMFGWELPPFNSGGLGVACYGLARALVRSGAEIIFVLPRYVDVDADFMRVRFAQTDSDVTIRTIDTILAPYMTDTSYQKCRRAGDSNDGQTLYDEVMSYAVHARKIAEEEKCDYIYTHDWLSFPAGLAAKEVTGKPLIAHVHATEYDRGAGSVNDHIFAIEKEGIEKADHVIAVSNYTKEVIMKQYEISSTKIDVVHNGVEEEDFATQTSKGQLLAGAKSQGVSVVLFVGRLTAQKGFEFFLEAAKRALTINQKMIFVVAGSGDLEEAMMHRVAEMGISDKILFMGFVRGQELQEVYASADLFVMPSVSEPFGITALEAMLHGTPVIVSRQSGVSEVASHTLKVDFWDIDDMAQKILSVVDSDTLRKQMTINAQREVGDLSWERAAKKCLWIFHNKVKDITESK